MDYITVSSLYCTQNKLLTFPNLIILLAYLCVNFSSLITHEWNRSKFTCQTVLLQSPTPISDWGGCQIRRFLSDESKRKSRFQSKYPFPLKICVKWEKLPKSRRCVRPKRYSKIIFWRFISDMSCSGPCS